jgi:membrane associated rhomboid family serine protease
MAGRFSFSLPERRHGGDPWFRIGQVDVTTTVLVAGLCVLSMVVWAIDSEALARLALIPSEVRSGEIWRIVTWPLYNEPDIWTVIAIAIFWFFGREIEGRLGRSKFALMLLIMTVVPGIVGTLLDIVEFGIRPIEFGVFLVFVAGNPFARFFFGIPAWVLALVFVGLEVLQLLGVREEDRIVLLFVSIATALITARSMGLAEAAPWIPAVPWGGGGGSSSSRRSTKRSRPPRSEPPRGGGGVVAGPWAAPGGGRASGGPLPQPPADPSAARDHAELDELLDKISAGGLDALSPAEKRRLNELSKRMRGSR